MNGDVWGCRCGRMVITLPFKPLLLSPCCLQEYVLLRRAES